MMPKEPVENARENHASESKRSNDIGGCVFKSARGVIIENQSETAHQVIKPSSYKLGIFHWLIKKTGNMNVPIR